MIPGSIRTCVPNLVAVRGPVEEGGGYRQTHRHTDTQTRRHTGTRTHAHTHTRTHAHSTHAHTHTRTHAHTHTRTHAHKHTRTHAHTHNRTHAKTRAHAHARTHTHTHTTIEQPLPDNNDDDYNFMIMMIVDVVAAAVAAAAVVVVVIITIIVVIDSETKIYNTHSRKKNTNKINGSLRIRNVGPYPSHLALPGNTRLAVPGHAPRAHYAARHCSCAGYAGSISPARTRSSRKYSNVGLNLNAPVDLLLRRGSADCATSLLSAVTRT